MKYFLKNLLRHEIFSSMVSWDTNFNWKICKTLLRLQKSIKIHKRFLDYLSNKSNGTIFLQSTDKEEVATIISSLNSNKASSPNSIPYRLLFLLKQWNFKAIDWLIQPLLHDWCFPCVLKTTKVVLVFTKDYKLDYSNYRPISLSPNIEKVLEKLMYKRLCTFLNNKNIYCLQFRFRQQHTLFYKHAGNSSVLESY